MQMRCLIIVGFLLLGTNVLARPYDYRVTDQMPQSRKIFTQGLEIVDGQLYISSGGYGKSRLMRFNLADGSLEREHRLHPRLFAEGITVLGERIYQLTWRAQQLIVYKREDLSVIERWQIPGEGWGMTNNGQSLIYSDGSDQLYFVAPDSKRIERVLAVTEDGEPVDQLNELEWIDDKIWANIWRSDRIVMIDPHNGKVVGSLNLDGLLPLDERRPDTNVLNGIALNRDDGTIWVTGKNWPWMYQIELLPETENKQREATP